MRILNVEIYREKGYMEKRMYYKGGWKTVRRPFELPYTYTAHDLEGFDDINERWKRSLMTRYPTGSHKESVGALIGTALHPYKLGNWGEDEDWYVIDLGIATSLKLGFFALLGLTNYSTTR